MNPSPIHQTENDYEWILFNLSSCLLEEELLIYLYDYFLFNEDSKGALSKIYNEFIKYKNLPLFFELNKTDDAVVKRLDWVLLNITSIITLIEDFGDKIVDETFMIIEYFINIYIDWKINNKDFSLFYDMVKDIYGEFYLNY